MYQNLTELIQNPDKRTEPLCGKTKQELIKSINWIKNSPVSSYPPGTTYKNLHVIIDQYCVKRLQTIFKRLDNAEHWEKVNGITSQALKKRYTDKKDLVKEAVYRSWLLELAIRELNSKIKTKGWADPGRYREWLPPSVQEKLRQYTSFSS